MKFLVDRCAGKRVVDWLREEAHDVFDAREIRPDPGDRALLQLATESGRIVVTLDADFSTLVFLEGERHSGMIRLPDVPAKERIRLLSQVVERIDATSKMRRSSP